MLSILLFKHDRYTRAMYFLRSTREISLFLSHCCVIPITCTILEQAFPIFVVAETRCTPRAKDTRLAEWFRYIDASQGASYLVRSKFARFYTGDDDKIVWLYLKYWCIIHFHDHVESSCNSCVHEFNFFVSLCWRCTLIDFAVVTIFLKLILIIILIIIAEKNIKKDYL